MPVSQRRGSIANAGGSASASTIAFVRTVDKKTNNNTLSVPAAGCALGNTIIVTAITNGTSPLTGVSDSKGNTYVVDKTANAAVNGSVTLAHSVLTAALVSGDTLTLTFAGGDSRVSLAQEFSGISAFDKDASANATSTTVDTGNTAALTNTGELYIAGIRTGAAALTDVTTGLTNAGDDFNSYYFRYKVLGATTAAVSYQGTCASTEWVAVVGTYK